MNDLQLDVQSTALVVIDLQRGIVARPTLPHTTEEVVARAADLARAFRAKRGLVVLVHVDPGPHGELMPSPIADRPRPSMADVPADFAELLPELDRQASDVVVLKHQPNAFYATDLEVHLQRRGIRTIVLAGVSTNLGVEATARAAFERGYEQVFVEDAMSARETVHHTHAVQHFFPTIGRVRSTADVLNALR